MIYVFQKLKLTSTNIFPLTDYKPTYLQGNCPCHNLSISLSLGNFTTQKPNKVLNVFELKLNSELKTNQCELFLASTRYEYSIHKSIAAEWTNMKASVSVSMSAYVYV